MQESIAGSRRRSLLLCAALLALNPLWLALHSVAAGLFPDSLLYLTFSRELLAHGRLYLEGWGHVDAGVVLPPLYPLLVGIWGRISGDLTAASSMVSATAMFLATVPMALIAFRLAGAVFGFLAVLVIFIHPFVLRYGTFTLTEALFVLGLASIALGAMSFSVRPASWKACVLGVGAGLLLLVRTIGGFTWPALVVIGIIVGMQGGPGRLSRSVRYGTFITLGFGLVLVPYVLAVHEQIGEWPTAQSFRLHRYEVSYVQAQPVLAAAAPNDYAAVYAERRRQRVLTDDSSEMLDWVLNPAQPEDPLTRAKAMVGRAARNAFSNVELLGQSLGWLTTLLLGVCLVTPLLHRSADSAGRWVLPVLICSYFGALSLFSGIVLRYAEILVPFALIQIFSEAQRWSSLAASAATRPERLRIGVGFLLAIACVASLPATLRSVSLGPRLAEGNYPLTACRANLTPGEPVFAFHPFGVYLLAGTFRVVPNDEIGKVLIYAARTGVRYLLWGHTPAEETERKFYWFAPWAHDESAFPAAAGATTVCHSADGMATLYRLTSQSGGRQGDR